MFAVLAGVSTVLLTGASARIPRPGARRRLVVRAVLLFALGLGLSALGGTVKEILTVYAVLFLLAAPLLAVRSAVLAAAAAVLTVGGPVLSFLLRRDVVPPAPVGRTPSVSSLTSSDGLADLARGLLLDGAYPVLTWLPFVLVGMLVARADLRLPVVAGRLAAGGAVVAVVTAVVSWLATGPLGGFRAIAAALGTDVAGVERIAATPVGAVPIEHPGFLLIASPHAGSPPEILSSGGCAVAVIGTCLLAARHLPGLLRPLAAVGRLALSCYTGHIVLFAAIGVPGLVALLTGYGYVPLLVLLAVTPPLAVAWSRAFGRGPLERALRAGGWFPLRRRLPVGRSSSADRPGEARGSPSRSR